METLSVDIAEDTSTILAPVEQQDRKIKKLRELIPNPQVIFKLSANRAESKISIDRGLWRVIAMINGKNFMMDICIGLKANECSVCRVLFYLRPQPKVHLRGRLG